MYIISSGARSTQSWFDKQLDDKFTDYYLLMQAQVLIKKIFHLTCSILSTESMKAVDRNGNIFRFRICTAVRCPHTFAKNTHIFALQSILSRAAKSLNTQIIKPNVTL